MIEVETLKQLLKDECQVNYNWESNNYNWNSNNEDK